MKWDLVLTLAAWSLFLFVWLPLRYIKHRKLMSSLRAINKGSRFKRKYQALKRLAGSSS